MAQKALIYSFFLAVLLTIFSCARNDNHITIAVTTDVHGSIFSHSLSDSSLNRYSISKISSYLRSLKKKETILLDNGDNLQGSPSVYYFNFEDTVSPHIWPRILNWLGYDALTVGNHDIEAGHSVYDRLRGEYRMPMLAANAIDTVSGKSYFEPFTIIRRGKYRIAVIGLITPGIPGWLPPVLYDGIEFRDMVETAELTMKQVKKFKPDLVVGLFHSGWDETYGGGKPGSYLNENASLSVASKVEGFDVIFIGHDHDRVIKKIQTPSGDSVYVIDSGSNARNIAVAGIDFLKNGREKKLSVKPEIIDAGNLDPDKEFDSLFSTDYRAVSEYVNHPAGNLSKAISTRNSYFGDSPFMDLIHSVQLDVSGADISFAAPLSYDVTIPAGEMTVDDMFSLYRYENMLYTISLKGDEIDRYLEYSVSLWFNTMSAETDHLILFDPERMGRLKNRYYSFDSAEGIDYTIDVTHPVGNKVTITGFSDGRNFYPDSTYTVALNSYRGSGGGGHLNYGAGLTDEEINERLIKSTEKDLRFFMIEWFKKNHIVEASTNNNWSLVPLKYTVPAGKKDYELMFNR